MFTPQIATAIPSTPLELILSATVATKVVLVVLAVLSLVSWGVMLSKWLEFSRVTKTSAVFLAEFTRASRLDHVAATAKRVTPSPYTRVFARAIQFLLETRPLGVDQNAGGGTLSASQVEALRLVLDAETNSERDQLGRYIPALAVIGSASPLLGLLGTVLGIITSFLGVAAGGSGNLAAVAPGVAEALIATAAALAVAIPATFGYNIFANKLNRFDGALEGFGSEIIALMAREGRI
ncbi:MAG: MotA/TolQ/ExbB proton channel family protein [Gemmatimonadetes bacterium]|nr:MotA/TolQ/ExbB proton channel family protein [Gemmatimonadota bacterium]